MDPELGQGIAWFIIVSGLCGLAVALMHMLEGRIVSRKRRQR